MAAPDPLIVLASGMIAAQNSIRQPHLTTTAAQLFVDVYGAGPQHSIPRHDWAVVISLPNAWPHAIGCTDGRDRPAASIFGPHDRLDSAMPPEQQNAAGAGGCVAGFARVRRPRHGTRRLAGCRGKVSHPSAGDSGRGGEGRSAGRMNPP